MPPPTAVFVANDHMAIGLLGALHDNATNVPGDVAVVGFDDIPMARYLTPPLTTVHRSIDEIGEGAAEAMIDLIEGRTPRAKVPSPTLAIRESTRPLRN